MHGAFCSCWRYADQLLMVAVVFIQAIDEDRQTINPLGRFSPSFFPSFPPNFRNK